MAYGTVNVPGASEAAVEAAKEAAVNANNTAQAVSNKIGAAGDTGGSTTAGTVMGKLNKLISDLAAHMGRWTAARAGYIDTINTNAANIKAKTDTIGATGDTGGSTTAGTVMGKLNKAISDLTTHMGRWTATRAGYIDTINTNASSAKTDAAAAKTNTATNNTASATGTLSQKLSHVINLLASGSVNTKLDTIVSQTSSAKVIKSIQRGNVDSGIIVENGNSYAGAKITINAVDPNKSVVLVNGSILSGSSTYGCILSSLTEKQLIITAKPDSSGGVGIIGWQVIEFY